MAREVRGGEAQTDRASLFEKYRHERDKRMVEGRAAIRDLPHDEYFGEYLQDPFTPFVDRAPLHDRVDVAIIGAGLAGLTLGAQLRKAGVGSIRLIDRAGGPGGTWYWNRYPGVMCDVESYVYMPMLEELGYIPTRKYAFGDEIRHHLEAIADRYNLLDEALFHTGVIKSEWDEDEAGWLLTTDRNDEIRAHYLVMAIGILNLMKLPVIPGMETFRGRSFHTARWDYGYTGGTQEDPRLTGLDDKVVGLLGTGASSIQAVPPLAESAKHLYVLQRTPSAIGERGNRPTSEDFTSECEPGWQRARMDNFSAVMHGHAVERDLIDDGWTRDWRRIVKPTIDPEMSLDEAAQLVEGTDFAIMDAHRDRVSNIVADPDTAEKLKPYYRYACKRPCFHDEYLEAFNRPNVTLLSCPGGVDRVTERGMVVNGAEIELDCIIYATGFEAESTPFPRRAGHPIIGRDGIELADKFADGPKTFHGMMTHGFPNLFLMPAPLQQAVVTTNYTHVAVEGADHIASTIALLEKKNVRIVDVTEEAEAAWVAEIVGVFTDRSEFMAACTPSRINHEGDMGKINPLAGGYGGGAGNFFAWRQVITDWRERDELAGLELDYANTPE